MKAQGEPVLQILVVDDEPTVRNAIQMLLVHFGHVVQGADNGTAALARLETVRFNLVITDYAMPGMPGDELAALIKLRQPSLPIIMVTAFAYGLKANAKVAENVDYLLNKPFTVTELLHAIARVRP